MEVLKTATDWAKDEILSSTFFMLFGLVFIAGTIGFWQLGKTDLAKAFVYPTLVCGILLLVVGIGLFYSNKTRLNNFPGDYSKDQVAFVQSELERADKTIGEFTTVFRVIPIIIIVAALLLIFMDKPIWRAVAISTIAMMVVIMGVDGNSNARMKVYKDKLVEMKG